MEYRDGTMTARVLSGTRGLVVSHEEDIREALTPTIDEPSPRLDDSTPHRMFQQLSIAFGAHSDKPCCASAECAMRPLAEQKATARQLMPRLSALKAAVRSVHRVYEHAYAAAATSDAWAYSWGAGDVNQVPFNHHACIKFLDENEEFLRHSATILKPISTRLGRGEHILMDDEQRAMMQQWLQAWDMRTQLRDLEIRAPYWRSMREEYGEWSVPNNE